MSKLILEKLIHEPFYSYQDFSKAKKLATEERPIATIIEGKDDYHPLSSYLSAIYNRKWKMDLVFRNRKNKLGKKEIYNQILDNINMIESTLLYWITMMVNKPRGRTSRVFTIKDFSKQTLEDQILKTNNLVPLSYLNDRNLESLMNYYQNVIEEDKKIHPGRYGRTNKIK